MASVAFRQPLHGGGFVGAMVATFPPGTEVAVYPAHTRSEGRRPIGVQPLATATVSGSGVEFDGLQERTPYVAHGVVSDEHRYVAFQLGRQERRLSWPETIARRRRDARLR